MTQTEKIFINSDCEGRLDEILENMVGSEGPVWIKHIQDNTNRVGVRGDPNLKRTLYDYEAELTPAEAMLYLRARGLLSPKEGTFIQSEHKTNDTEQGRVNEIALEYHFVTCSAQNVGEKYADVRLIFVTKPDYQLPFVLEPVELYSQEIG